MVIETDNLMLPKRVLWERREWNAVLVRENQMRESKEVLVRAKKEMECSSEWNVKH